MAAANLSLDTAFAETLYRSMLYDIAFDALPKMLAHLVGEGGFISVYNVIAEASKRVYSFILEKMPEKPKSLREAAMLMKLMAEIHNRFGDATVGVPRIHVEIVSDHEAYVKCRGSGFKGNGEHRYVPVVFVGLVGGFLEALGFHVKPLRSEDSVRFLQPGELGVLAEGDSRECIVKVVSKA